MKGFLGRKQVYLRVIAAVLLTCIVLLGIEDRFTRDKVINFNDSKQESEYIDINEYQIRQYFTITQPVKNLYVSIKNPAENIRLKLLLYDAETDALLAQAETTMHGDENEAAANFVLEETAEFSRKDQKRQLYYTIQEEKQIPVLLSVTVGDYKENLFLDQERTAYRSRFGVCVGQISYPWMLLLFGMLLFAVLLLLLTQTERIWKIVRIERVFLLLALLGGIGFAVINPPSQESDGWEHYLRSIDVSYGNILAPFLNITHQENVIIVPENVNSFQFQVIEPNLQMGSLYVENIKQMEFSTHSREMKYESIFVSLFYLPQGLGLFLGRSLGLHMYGAVLLARLLNLFSYIGLTFFAIRWIPCHKNLLMLIALLPISLFQSASCSPDALLHGLSFLFLAVCLNFAYVTEVSLKMYHGLILGVLLSLLFLCKYIYIFMGLLVFLIPVTRFGGKREYAKAFFLALIPLVSIIVLMLPSLTGSVQMSAGHQEGMTQLQFVLSNPLAFVKMLISTFVNNFEFYVERLNVLGWLNYSLGPLTVVIPCFMTAVGIMDTNAAAVNHITRKDRVLLLLAAGSCIAAMMLGLYISDGRINPVGSGNILGVQGRYFIPMLALIFIAFSSKKLSNQINFFTMKTAAVIGIALLYTELVLLRTCY